MFDKPRIPIRDMVLPGALPARVQRAIYRRRGYRIADDVALAAGSVIEADEVSIGPGTSIGLGCVLRGKSIVIGRRVSIGAFCIFEGRDIVIGDDTSIQEQVFVGGPVLPDSKLELGRRVHIYQTCFLNPSRPLTIGDDTGIGGRSSIFTHGSWQSVMDGYPVTFEPVTIGKDVWLPWHVFVLPGVVIGDGATVGGGSVLNRSIPPRTLAAGVPAKVLREQSAWPREIDDDQRWDICRQVTTLMAAYLTDAGVPVQVVEDSGDRILLALTVDSRSRRVEAVRDPTTARNHDLVISLRLPPAESAQTARTFLGLHDRRRAGPRDALVHEVENFWGRYGIRFLEVGEACSSR
jgi:acetyltransferase-like isoleucine patch superfamily enzyme